VGVLLFQRNDIVHSALITTAIDDRDQDLAVRRGDRTGVKVDFESFGIQLLHAIRCPNGKILSLARRRDDALYPVHIDDPFP
jgi:hypothetical protein